jgi:uncharacterized protein YndB with AHSA1/START domain
MPQASIDIDASPEAVYAMVSDLPAMGRWSPECYRCTWRGGASGAAAGARFKGYNRIGMRRWSTDGTVVTADPGRELTFDVTYYGFPVARWSYRITPREGGCTVTESTEDRRNAVVRALGAAFLVGTAAFDRGARNQDTIQVTLERIKAEAEAAARAGEPAGA